MTLTRLKTALGILAFLAFAAFLHWTLPQRDIVRIVEIDVVRQDVERVNEQGETVTVTRDVRFIYAKAPDGDDRVYRNEDTGWGWPPYLKFDTADLAAQAADMISTAENPKWVVIRHYGWRIPLFSMYPNALSLRPAKGPDEELFPWFNVLFVTFLALGLLIARRLLLMAFRSHPDPEVERIERERDMRAGPVRGRLRRARRWVRYHFGA